MMPLEDRCRPRLASMLKDGKLTVIHYWGVGYHDSFSSSTDEVSHLTQLYHY